MSFKERVKQIRTRFVADRDLASRLTNRTRQVIDAWASNRMQPHDFNWYDGRIAYWGLDRLHLDKPIELQLEELKEDLAQVEFDSDTILDVGWYPELSLEGKFVIVVVRSHDWESPLFRVECRQLAHLSISIRAAIKVARSIKI
jgi:hypothetical protein